MIIMCVQNNVLLKLQDKGLNFAWMEFMNIQEV